MGAPRERLPPRPAHPARGRLNPPSPSPLDALLGALARRIADNYARFDPSLWGGRILFTIEIDGKQKARTLLFDQGRPRLFVGHLVPPKEDREQVPFLHLKATLEELADLLTGQSGPSRSGRPPPVFEGNSEALRDAVGRCL